jgi:aminodeoxyfutalosine synthase
MHIEEITELFTLDLHELGEMADSINRANGNYATFVINKHINYTNVCISRCPICAFYAKNDTEAYLMSVEEVVDAAREAWRNGATELHIVGSHNPTISLEYFEKIFSRIKEEMDITIKALTATEIHFLAEKEELKVKEVLKRLKDAGLDAMPGGGAEILKDEIRDKICPDKAKSQEWLEVMRTAHKLGIKSNATMLFGHIESYRDRAEHLYQLYKLQKETGGFMAFIPLVFHPDNTKFSMLKKTSPADILKTIAVSRIVLENFKSIRAYWVMLGEKLTQIALNYGANDVDGTLMGENISHAAGAKTPKELTVERLIKLIKGAEKIPAQRDTFNNILRVFE